MALTSYRTGATREVSKSNFLSAGSRRTPASRIARWRRPGCCAGAPRGAPYDTTCRNAPPDNRRCRADSPETSYEQMPWRETDHSMTRTERSSRCGRDERNAEAFRDGPSPLPWQRPFLPIFMRPVIMIGKAVGKIQRRHILSCGLLAHYQSVMQLNSRF
jgi:hypothetical protein